MLKRMIRPSYRILFLVLLLLLTLSRLAALPLLNISWDEFLFLSRVWLYASGGLERGLQTFHVHIFHFLTWFDWSEDRQILFARVVLFLASLGSLYALWRVARSFLGRTASFCAVLCMGSHTAFFLHGSSFRADPICLFLVLSTLALLLSGPARWRLALSAVLFALSCVVSIKTLFYLPTVLWCVWQPEGSWRRACAFAGGVLTCVAALFLVHHFAIQSALPETGPASAAAGGQGDIVGVALAAARKVFLDRESFQNWNWVKKDFRQNLPIYLLAGLGIFGAFYHARGRVLAGRSMRLAGAALFFAAPLLSLLIYRNTYPYYFVFLLLPLSFLAAFAVQRFVLTRPRVLAPLLVFVALHPATQLWSAYQDRYSSQARYLDAVREAFPGPVPYVDRCGMVSSYRSVGFFMSSWGIDAYRAAGASTLQAALNDSDPPRFLLANHPCLRPDRVRSKECAFYTKEDARALSENFVPHWGDLWVLGKRLKMDAGQNAPLWIHLSGRYTNVGEHPVSINRRLVAPGERLYLPRGRHSVWSGVTAKVLLRYGMERTRPGLPPPVEEIFVGF
jgi:hypothetical protein